MTSPSKKDDTAVVVVVSVPEDATAGHETNNPYPSHTISTTSTPFASTAKLPLAAPSCPDGGVVAWAQVLASFLMNAVGWGYPATFGMYQLHYVSNMGLPGSQIAWVGSVQTFLAYALCVVAGRLADAGYIRSTVSVGSVFVVVGTLATSWAAEYWQILLAQGLCTGLGLGLITTPTLTVVNSYFDSNRSVAVASATAGTGVGSIVFPAVVQLLIPQVGFAWAVRCSALVTLVFCSVGVVLLKPREQPQADHGADAATDEKSSLGLIDMGALRERAFLCLAASSFLFFIALYFGFFYLTVIAQQVAHMSPTTCVTLLMINSAVGIPIRPLSGMIADRFPRVLGPVKMFAITVLLVGAAMLAWIAARSSADMYIFAVGFGIVNGASQSIWPGALISITPDPKRLGVRYGMLCVFVAVATLVGPPIAAMIVDAAARGGGNGFMAAQAWAGALALVSGVLAFGARPSPLSKSEIDEKV
ncbi:hypothetical protein MCOR27_003133 [Pyricularia oryzae]|uniref:Major facilitator superfamily (MFS) profile domain-containing protein n=2 Tax=Pyricularia TaxID=48558 RepID=A0ABQ8NT88_PYRGI|nr:hypothetical protein MCOR01_008826 [Pyricularia oryzae]KAI6301814.1 hypothetical protein MCOR33_002795 [Pyricularia grisea]KAI6252437.1 hypothetical protein MCOR19_010953 [Pyricularia oryzae]KAI6273736.1 hypothetical protein MCOR26_006745 [Pyricularia oryzae]KAI6283603.1 hypothetical protein MCOR27_003133 [Pyricularia oryzae]